MEKDLPITDGGRRTVLGPLFDEYVEAEPARYLVHEDDREALNYITSRIEQNVRSDLLPPSKDELRECVEWWVRKEYRHLAEPRANPEL